MLINSPNISGSLTVTGNAVITGSLTVAGGINATITGSATSASYVEYSNVANKPALVSGSSQVTYSGLTGVPSGIVSGSSQITYSGISGIPSGIVSGSSQVTYSGLTGVPSGIVSSSTQVTGYSIFATTGSNQFNGSQAVTGSLTVTGQVVAQTLNVQQVTSSIVYSSGSNIFGNSSGNTQQLTGSVGVTGSLTVAGAATFNLGSGEMRLNRTGTSEFLKLNTYYLLSDGNDQLLGSVTGATSIYAGNGVSPRLTITSGGNVGIGTVSPTSVGTYYTSLELKGKSGGTGNEGGYYLTTDADGSTVGQFGVDGNFVYLGSRSNTDAVLTRNNSEILRVTANGLTFNGDTAAANALDDYEEGTWTPTLSGGTSGTATSGGNTYGNYTKIGRLVTLNFVISLSSVNTLTGNVYLTGIPFNLAAGAALENRYPAGATTFGSLNTSWASITIASDGNTTKLLFSGTKTPATSTTNLTNTDLTNSSSLAGSIQYIA